ncbi:hypothetical protein KKC17_00070 [Patescibacteria group bacterium]|nr:hypothetical protein [Patescibacteria group bacterium]
MREILGRQVEGDEDGVFYLDRIDAEAESLFKKAKYEHRVKFKDDKGRHFIMTRSAAGRYLVAQTDSSSGWF